MARALDIQQPQVLVHYPDDDDNDLLWHHRILLCKAGAGSTWVCASPDLDICIHDLATHRHIVLGRSSAFPARVADQLYAFDPLSPAELADLVRQARLHARILSGEEMAERERHRGEYEYVAPERRREEERREATLDPSYEPSPNEAPSSSGRQPPQ